MLTEGAVVGSPDFDVLLIASLRRLNFPALASNSGDNVLLISGIGTGKSHLAVAIARNLLKQGQRGRFFNVVDQAEGGSTLDADRGQFLCRLTRWSCSSTFTKIVSPVFRGHTSKINRFLHTFLHTHAL